MIIYLEFIISIVHQLLHHNLGHHMSSLHREYSPLSPYHQDTQDT